MKRVFIIVCLMSTLFVHLNGQIIAPRLDRVTIDTGTQNVIIYWSPSPSPGIVYYKILKWLLDFRLSGHDVDSIYLPSPLQYTYHEPEALLHPVGYSVRALIDSKHGSTSSNLDSTVFLDHRFDSCTATIDLHWNIYNSWHSRIASYKIYESIDNNSYNLNSMLEESINHATIHIDANHNYRYFVLTTRDDNLLSFSNVINVNTRMSAVPEKIDADYGTVINGRPNLAFSVDPTSELTNYVLLRSDKSTGPFDSISNIHSAEKEIVYIDSVDASKQPYYYRLKALNNCSQDARISENTASTLFMQIQNNNPVIHLNWTAYENWLGGIEAYHIERSLNNGNFEEIDAVNNLTYDDRSMQNQAGNNIDSRVCYRVIAHEASGKESTSISNENCVELYPNIRFEFNAFIPGSADNGTFGPKIDFIPESFSFQIFNRWGTKIYQSNDPLNDRWDGIFSGSKVPEGVYHYQVEYKTGNNKKEILQGEVTVVYP